MNKFQNLITHPPLIIALILAIIVFFLLTLSVAKRHFRDEPIHNFPSSTPVVTDPVTPDTNNQPTTDQQ